MSAKLLVIISLCIVTVAAILFSLCYKTPFDGTSIVQKLEKLRWNIHGNDSDDTEVRPFKIKFQENVSR